LEKEKNCKLAEHPRRGASFYNSLFPAEGEWCRRPGLLGVPFFGSFLGKQKGTKLITLNSLNRTKPHLPQQNSLL
ncbi:MAG: hypothetical protein PF568_01260, partial [Deltaproteobacteria bacterium]|nr:hypothetical protein [Deltaproteobacteria bacterium]